MYTFQMLLSKKKIPDKKNVEKNFDEFFFISETFEIILEYSETYFDMSGVKSEQNSIIWSFMVFCSIFKEF